jgi:Zn-dependent M28 family amino/carboxypeptidase
MMVRCSRVVVLVVGLIGCTSYAAAQNAATSPSTTRRHVETLASEKLDGRLTGSEGERLAGDYLVAELKRIGALPLPGLPDYRVPFEFTAGSRDAGSTVEVSQGGSGRAPGKYAARSDVQVLSFSDNADITGQVVFAGYGLVVPEGQDFGYDSYTGLDIKDKVVLVLRYFPENADLKVKTVLARYSDLRYKAMAARQRGAKAMLVVTGPRSPNAGETIPMSFDTALAGSGIAAASISHAVAEAIFAAVEGKTFEATQQSLDTGNPHVAGFEIPVTVTLHTAVAREKQVGRNIVAYLPATGGAPQVPKPWIALGAHYDHLGHGRNGNSLARKEEAGQIHFGADDNASGTSAVLAVGEALSKLPRRRNILLDFWSGEELGLIGSGAFAAKPPVPVDQIAAYLNFDMVGRMQDNKLNAQAVGTSLIWAKVLEQANVTAGFDLQLQQDPYLPTDVASFNQAGVPSLNFFTGSHSDYHRPTDTADKINYEDLDRIVGFATGIAKKLVDLDEPPAFVKVDQPSQGAGRAGMRVFTGTIPDYTAEVKGLLLGGVVGGGPAEKAGLQKGDVIVELAGQSITNVYDYTYALELLKIGEPVKVVYQRDNKRVETTLTPAARR